MSNGRIMSDREARELLDLPKTGVLDRAMVDSAYNRHFRDHQGKLNSAFTPEEKNTEVKILGLLTEAKNICLGIGARPQAPAQNSSIPRGTAWTGVPQTASRPKRSRSSRHGSVRDAALRFGDVFVHLGLALKNLFGFARAVPAAFSEMKDVVCELLDQIQTAGIPKFVVVVVLILGFLPLINGCAQAIHKMAGWFK